MKAPPTVPGYVANTECLVLFFAGKPMLKNVNMLFTTTSSVWGTSQKRQHPGRLAERKVEHKGAFFSLQDTWVSTHIESCFFFEPVRFQALGQKPSCPSSTKACWMHFVFWSWLLKFPLTFFCYMLQPLVLAMEWLDASFSRITAAYKKIHWVIGFPFCSIQDWQRQKGKRTRNLKLTAT